MAEWIDIETTMASADDFQPMMPRYYTAAVKLFQAAHSPLALAYPPPTCTWIPRSSSAGLLQGVFKVELYPTQAPKTCRNFKELCATRAPPFLHLSHTRTRTPPCACFLHACLCAFSLNLQGAAWLLRWHSLPSNHQGSARTPPCCLPLLTRTLRRCIRLSAPCCCGVRTDFMVQGGDPTGSGRGGESIYGGKFADEIKRELKHTGAHTPLPQRQSAVPPEVHGPI